MASRLAYRLEYVGIKAVAGVLSLLSRRAAVKLGKCAGRAAFHLIPYAKRTLMGNLRLAYPGEDEGKLRRIALANMEHMGRIGAEFVLAREMSAKELLSIVRVEGIDVLDAARARGKGVLILSAHLGNWEYSSLALSAMGLPCGAIGRRIHNPYVDEMVNEARTHLGATIIGHRDAARKVIKALKAEGIVTILLDQRARLKEWTPSVFFGQPVATNHGLAIFALRCGAPVVFTTCLTDGAGYTLRFEEIIEPPPEGGSLDERVNAFTRLFDARLEKSVRERPEEWFWIHRRWKLPRNFAP